MRVGAALAGRAASSQARLAPEEDAARGQASSSLNGLSVCLPQTAETFLLRASTLVNDHHALSSMKIKLT